MKYKKASDKWMAIAEGRELDRGPDNCVLCRQYHDADTPQESCKGCPICDDTGVQFCLKTPHEQYEWHHDSHPFLRELPAMFCPECQLLALNEWLYLKSIGE